jgi:hypothetical protein
MTSPFRGRVPRSVLTLILVVVGIWMGRGTGAQAQEFGRLQEMKEQTNVAYFYFARPGDATVQVQVQGTVPRPGIYEVPDSIDLNRLLTMAGGAAFEPRPENRKRPDITIRVYRPGSNAQQRGKLLEASFEEVVAGEKRFRQFRDDDIIVVETVQERRFTIRDIFSFSSSLFSLALLIVRIIDIGN